MLWYTLPRSPALPPLYWRAALKRKITGTTLPDSGLHCRVQVNPAAVMAYRKVCGFAESPMLPATYPHIMAFGLQLRLLTAPQFPFPLLGLVHLSNRIRVFRPMGGVSEVRVSVHTRNLQPHAKGATFDLITTVEDSLGLLWEGESQMLCRGVKLDGEVPEQSLPAPSTVSELTRWKAPSDIGRRYARVSGDYNPIHLSALTAKLFGFPRRSPMACGTRRALWRPCMNIYPRRTSRSTWSSRNRYACLARSSCRAVPPVPAASCNSRALAISSTCSASGKRLPEIGLSG